MNFDHGAGFCMKSSPSAIRRAKVTKLIELNGLAQTCLSKLLPEGSSDGSSICDITNPYTHTHALTGLSLVGHTWSVPQASMAGEESVCW